MSRAKELCCPFCARKNAQLQECPREGWFHVICPDCAAEGPATQKPGESIKRWNDTLSGSERRERATRPPLAGETEPGR